MIDHAKLWRPRTDHAINNLRTMNTVGFDQSKTFFTIVFFFTRTPSTYMSTSSIAMFSITALQIQYMGSDIKNKDTTAGASRNEDHQRSPST